jgi:PAS domain S-box-containing protein
MQWLDNCIWRLIGIMLITDKPHGAEVEVVDSPGAGSTGHMSASEARFRAILEAALDGIISIDARGLIQTVNAAAERLFGYRASELLGKNVTMLMPPPYRDEHDGYMSRYIATGERRIIGIGREVVGARKDGTTFPIDLSVAEAWVGSERIFVGVIRDVTDRKRAEREIHESKAELESAVAELQAKTDEVRGATQQLWQAAKLASVGELAASIAHELNNPLGTVSLRIESILRRTDSDDPRRKGLEIIEQEIIRMGDLVSNLLQFSRRGKDQVSTLDVRLELNKAVELVQHHLRNRQINVVKELSDDTPTIFADRQKLRQVFLNLLSNASDAMLDGGTLTLRSAPTRDPETRPAVLIEICDTGAGIPEAFLDKVMEPFFTTKEEGKGTGLGLAICRRIVYEHRGTIQIQSQVGKGTEVRIVWPVQYNASADSVQAPSESW